MEKLVKLQKELKAPKGQKNKFGGYNYRNCEDILEAVKPLMDKHGLVLNLTDEVHEICGVMYTQATATVYDAKKTDVFVSSKAQAGIDPNQKGMSLGQCFGASSSYARKYALNGLLLIDDNKDPDVTNTHSTAKPRKTTTVEKKAGAKKKVTAGTAEYNKLLKWIDSPKGSLDKALEMYDIDKATENIIRKSVK
tara:strand:- start:1251 stop:1832 length:582 start_codon:yes stop_codon:yes gene_type:complete